MNGAIRLAILLTVLALGCAHRPLLEPSNGTRLAEEDVDGHSAASWREVDPENLLVFQLEWGDVFIELAPQFAPRHVEQMRRLVREGHYDDGATFYRVVDNFVAQGGVYREDDEEDEGVDPLPPEFERPLRGLVYVRNASSDLYAPETGHIDGFPVGYDPETGNVWPLHCYGTVAMARSSEPATGTSHFYIVNGRDQRYLDRNLTVFGRVLGGMEHVQRVARGDRAVGNGVIPDPADRTPILGVRVAADLRKAERPRLQVMRVDTPAFETEKTRRYYRDSDFFKIKPSVVEACAVPGPVRAAPEP